MQAAKCSDGWSWIVLMLTLQHPNGMLSLCCWFVRTVVGPHLSHLNLNDPEASCCELCATNTRSLGLILWQPMHGDR